MQMTLMFKKNNMCVLWYLLEQSIKVFPNLKVCDKSQLIHRFGSSKVSNSLLNVK